MHPIRLLWLALALTLLGFSIFEGVKHGWGATAVLIAAGLAPDLPLIGGFAGGGRLRRERVRAYNLLHHPLLPLAVAAAGVAVSFVTPDAVWLPVFLVGLAWLTHIAVDRAAGYGLRAADGTIRPVGVAARTPCSA
ncbi:DUF4260 family protein [Microbacterium dauci]|uniref:DUF4260 family protein n=1 Tax=Microbacterium dauci TaxID=3048008 RepID=A0ABT6ZAL7_9MICO|nr:DUF4260 family protein [Microbacterium sp. LX3-4]MDJ1113194.1 DUF4260 family protein [Microbacterium sp. LX3-4]